MKRAFILMLTVAMALSLAACGGNDNTPSGNNNTTPSNDNVTTTPTSNNGGESIPDSNGNGGTASADDDIWAFSAFAPSSTSTEQLYYDTGELKSERYADGSQKDYYKSGNVQGVMHDDITIGWFESGEVKYISYNEAGSIWYYISGEVKEARFGNGRITTSKPGVKEALTVTVDNHVEGVYYYRSDGTVDRDKNMGNQEILEYTDPYVQEAEKSVLTLIEEKGADTIPPVPPALKK